MESPSGLVLFTSDVSQSLEDQEWVTESGTRKHVLLNGFSREFDCPSVR